MSGVIAVTNNYCGSASYNSSIRVTTKNKAAGNNLLLVHTRLHVTSVVILGPGFRIIYEPWRSMSSSYV